MEARAHGFEACPAGVPAEDVVVLVVLATAGLDESNAGKETPVEIVGVCFVHEIGRELAEWATVPFKKFLDSDLPGILIECGIIGQETRLDRGDPGGGQ
jgi:hypothetical protein